MLAQIQPASVSLIFFTVGGVTVSGVQTAQALDTLRASPGMMVRQPLQRAGSPLAWCDYHSAAAPYRTRVVIPMAGRGAAGRHLTKTAFCLALEDAITQAAAGAPFAGLIAQAAAAFASDPSYGVSIARSAVSVLEARHRASLRLRLAESARDAITACEAEASSRTCVLASACGTGACPFAASGLAAVLTPAGPGKVRRPSRHVAGGTFDPGSGAAELEAAIPFSLAA